MHHVYNLSTMLLFLGGKLKGKTFQYHGLVGKELGQRLFDGFVGLLKEQLNGGGDKRSHQY